jgi:hypothetical protein
MSIPGGSNPLLLASAAGGGGGGYEISRSLRFNSSDSAYLSRAFDNTADNQKHTFSFWFKLSNLPSANENFFGAWVDDFYQTNCFISTTGAFNFYQDGQQAGPTGISTLSFYGTQVLRDYSAWYHAVISIDRTQSTSTDRFKVYLNGVDITANGSANYGDQNSVARWPGNSTSDVNIGRFYSSAPLHYNGYLADFHFIDGQALDPTSFGEFDTNGVWQPIDASGLTYGTNGFHLPFSDNSSAAALGTDTSGNGNDWTVNNLTAIARDYLKDCTGTPFDASYSFANMFDGSTGTYMTPITGTWATFAPSPAIAVTTLEIFGAWSGGASLAPKINGIDITNAPAGGAYQWFTPTLTGGVSITSLDSFEFYTAGGSNAFLVSAIRINGNILITGNPANNDSLVDSPTNYGTDTGAGGEVRGNYCTLNPLDNGGLTLSNGNLQFDRATASWISGRATIGMSSGKWYWEVVQTTGTSMMVGISKGDASQSSYVGAVATGWAYNSADGNKYNNASNSAYGNTYTTNDVIGVAFDVDSGDLKFYKNGTVQNSGTAAYTGLTSGPYFPAVSLYGTATAFTNFGQRPFAYTAPSGFKALCTTNLPEPTIADGSTAMDVALYTGNGSTQTISGLNFSPDLIWIKERNNSRDHVVQDIIRGSSVFLSTNLTNADQTTGGTGASSVGVQFFNSDGFTIGAGTGVNGSSNTYVAWTWDAGSSTVTDPAGSISSQVRANASAGFSVVTFTSPSSGTFTVGHGLGVSPSLIILKDRGQPSSWSVYHSTVTSKDEYLLLNTTAAKGSNTNYWGTTAPSSTVFGANAGVSVQPSDPCVAYCWTPVDGYSSFGSYTGNGSTDGPFVYTGFRPRWILLRVYNASQNWIVIDTARDPINPDSDYLLPNQANAEGTLSPGVDILSNGFKLRTSGTGWNGSGESVLYACFSEHPFATARAR